MWHTREIVWNIIQWAPFFKDECKPKRKDQIYKLSFDEAKKQEKQKSPKVTEQDLKVVDILKNGMKRDGTSE